MFSVPDRLILPSFRRARSLSAIPLTPKKLNFRQSTHTLGRGKRICIGLLLVCGFAVLEATTSLWTLSPLLSAISLVRPTLSTLPPHMDVTRSAHHKTVILPSMTYDLNLLNSTGVFPDWYGQPSDVGPSPYDYQLPGEWQRKTKWLFIVPDELSPMQDEEISSFISAVRSHRSFDVDTLDPHTRPSLKHAISGSDILVTFARYTKPDDSVVSALKRPKTTHVHILEECTGWECADDIFLRDGQITLARHAFELVDILDHHKLEARFGGFPMHLFAHWPWLAEAETFYPLTRWQDKTKDVLDVDGVLSNGYRGRVTAEDYRQAKICVFSSTPTRRMSREWTKAMLSGCVIVSDLPTDIEEVLAQSTLVHPQNAGPASIWALIEEALRDEASLQRRALHAFMYARQHFVPARQLGRLLQLVEQHRAGIRGYDFPMPFWLKCRVYPDGLRPTWCD